MGKVNKYYVVKLADDPTRKPRFYQSQDELNYGDKVITWNVRKDIPTVDENAIYKKFVGYVVGTIECSKNTIKRLVEQVGGVYPLCKCEKIKEEKEEEEKDIFVLMGICSKEESPIILLENCEHTHNIKHARNFYKQKWNVL